jgi:S-adenosylmethionine:tRNA ribosyltransferase-isomerase
MKLMNTLDFDLPSELIATAPIEASGRRRDEARLLVVHRDDPASVLTDTLFADLARFLGPGDVLVVNRSATLPAAVPTVDGLVLHFSTELPDGHWVVELRQPCGTGTLPHLEGRAGQHVVLPGGGLVELIAPLARTGEPTRTQAPVGPAAGPAAPAGRGVRLWVARVDVPQRLHDYLGAEGRPIRYGCTTDSWPLSAYQTLFADRPGSAEMPSAGRPFTPGLLSKLRRQGVVVVPIILHTGVSSPEVGEPPYAEWYSVPAFTAAAVNQARRVIAVGTTATRAIETVTGEDGVTRPGEGWTELVISAERGVRAVDGLLSGWHEPEASHLALLEAVAGRAALERSYAAALDLGYRWHEFGDLHLILP